MRKDWRKVREDIKKTEQKKREAEEQLRTLHRQAVQAENDEIIAVIRSMTKKGEDVMEKLKTVQQMQSSIEPERGIAANYESEVDIDD